MRPRRRCVWNRDTVVRAAVAAVRAAVAVRVAAAVVVAAVAAVRRWRGGTGNTLTGGFNNADNASLGDTNGMALPAILNEAISVTGTYPFPYTTDPSSTPNDPSIGVIPDPAGPILVFGNALTIGGTASTGGGGGGRRRWRWRRRAGGGGGG